MATDAAHDEGDLLDYEEEEDVAQEEQEVKADVSKKGYVGIHSTAFKDFLLKPELMRAIQKHGFEHPSEGAVGRGRAGSPVLAPALHGHTMITGRGVRPCCMHGLAGGRC